MSYPVEGPIPVIDLLPNASLTIEAVDPTTGATVAGVSFTAATLYAESISEGELHYLHTPPVLTQDRG